MSKSGVMGMTDSGGVRGTHAVHPRTILGVLKRSVGVDPQVNLTMEEVIDLIA